MRMHVFIINSNIYGLIIKYVFTINIVFLYLLNISKESIQYDIWTGIH